jgi:O-antigen biosynthesis protein WbqP
MKRLFDLLLALLIAMPAGLLIAMLAVIIRSETPGPALFMQTRIGRNGVHFTCIKLRTMYAGTPASPTHEASAAAVTRVGRFLRAAKLDELPQLWNIVRGEMSFVGPRPCLPAQTELIETRRRLGVLALVPGISGVSQIRGIDMSNPQLLAETDATYLRTQSIAEDIRIMVLTFMGSGRGDRTKA